MLSERLSEVADRLSPRAWAAVGALALFALVFLILVVLAITGPKADGQLQKFTEALTAGDLEAAGELTDSDPQVVADQLQANIDGLDGAALEATVEDVSVTGTEATGSVRMSWDVPELGRFEYTNTQIGLEKSDGEWLVRWSSRVIHPALREPGERLGTTEEALERAPILDRNGDALVAPTPVVEVGLRPGDADDLDSVVASLADLTDVDEAALLETAEAAGDDTLVPVITLREEEVAEVEAELRALDGVELEGTELPLAPTREFARHVLGTVGPATAEQVEESGGAIDADDIVGQSGLQAALEERLRGEPERSVVIRNEAGDAVETIEKREGEPGEPVSTTLETQVQSAAEDALDEASVKRGALVAVEPGSGAILAAATRPIEGPERALAGEYPPGSTFKVVTTAALLEAGLDPDETVDCPATIVVGDREFTNFESSAAGAVPFTIDFAESCNTAFVSLADRLEPADLPRTARLFGLGIEPELPLPASSGNVPRPADETELAEAMIGQGQVVASPLAMAGVAATVQAGASYSPRLLTEEEPEARDPLPEETAEELRTLMRGVVTSGTGTALATTTGEPIGKSGTAEFGTAEPPRTHAWFIAAREGIAVAVLVEGGSSGGEVAAPIAASFLAGVDAIELEPETDEAEELDPLE